MCACSSSSNSTASIVAEFDEWFEHFSANSSSTTIFLIENGRLRDGNVRLELSFSTGESFTVICPPGYPDIPRPLFQVRAESADLGLWACSMNQTHLGSVKLCGLLTEAVRRKSLGAISRVASDDEGMDDEMDEDEDDAQRDGDRRDNDEPDEDLAFNDDHFTTDWEIEVDILKKRWLSKQTALHATGTQQDRLTAGLQHKRMKNDMVVRMSDQIFSHNTASFQILTNEMVSLLRREQNDGVLVEPIDDDLYQWSIKISGFPRDSHLHAQLALIRERYGYDYIQLQLDYPFYPPLLRVFRPRFQGSLVQSLANIDLLKMTYWNPTRPMIELLAQMKTIVEAHALLEIDSPRNDRVAFPHGAYHPFEELLIQLALATEQRPRANYAILDVSGLEKAPQLKLATAITGESAEDAHRGGWAKGTGYGHGRTANAWNPEDYVLAQREKSRQVGGTLRENRGLLQVLNILTGLVNELHDAEREMGSAELTRVIEGSALLPFLECSLAHATLMEIARHVELFRLMLALIETLVAHDALLVLLAPLSNQKHSLRDHICKLANISQQYLNALGLQQSRKSDGGLRRKGKSKVCASASSDELGKSASDLDRDPEHEIAMRVTELERRVEERLAEVGLLPDDASTSRRPCPSAPSLSESPQDTSDYTRALRGLQFGTFDASLVGSSSHYFADKRRADLPPDVIKAIFRDFSSLQDSMPLTDSSSVFFRYDEENVCLAQALITGPHDTPYSCGCFHFDILFPDRYPLIPPQVNSRTNGGGTVRFNPNLYDNGKVCLSLLGTWNGERGESWNAATSTLLQVLVSIQSLILVDDPYFNEPGYEATRGTKEGDRRSMEYNSAIRGHCVKWAMLEQLRHPPPAFAHVIERHFRLKRDALKLQLNAWANENNKLKDVVKQTLVELDKL